MYRNNIHKFYHSYNYPLIVKREQIPRLLNDYHNSNKNYDNLVSGEIGVLAGGYSKHILENFSLVDSHFLIDCWKQQPSEIYNDAANKDDNTQENMYKSCMNRLKDFNNKLKVIRKFSSEAVLEIPDNYFDYLYIDGNHSYEAVKQDLQDWFPKMKKNSILAGHDYVNSPIFGVIKAVDEFCKQYNKILYLTKDPSENISWFIFI